MMATVSAALSAGCGLIMVSPGFLEKEELYAQHGGHDFGIFDQADADGDGRIDLNEWLWMISTWTKKGAGGQVVMDSVMLNVQGMIANAKEMIKLKQDTVNIATQEAAEREAAHVARVMLGQLHRWFNEADADGSGALDVDEMSTVLRLLYRDTGTSRSSSKVSKEIKGALVEFDE